MLQPSTTSSIPPDGPNTTSSEVHVPGSKAINSPGRRLLGELDESLPSTWEVYNKLCKNSGIDVLIWDWVLVRRQALPPRGARRRVSRSEEHQRREIRLHVDQSSVVYPLSRRSRLTEATPIRPVSMLRTFPMRRLSEVWHTSFHAIAIWTKLLAYRRQTGNLYLGCPAGSNRRLGLSETKRLFQELDSLVARTLGRTTGTFRHPFPHRPVSTLRIQQGGGLQHGRVVQSVAPGSQADHYQPQEVELARLRRSRPPT